MESAKRVRCTNFSNNEIEVLLTLVEDREKVIESKQTDATSNRDKDVEWQKLAARFNALVGSGRTAKQLRMKWDSLKKTTRKRYSSIKNSLYKTGGGPGEGELTKWEERILFLVGISATGIECVFDSDCAGEGS